MADVITNLRPMPASMPAVPPKKADPTNALRQRRHKAKRKAAAVTPPVAPPAPAPAEKPSQISAKVTPRSRPHTTPRSVRRQATTAIASGVVALGLMAVTLAHSARGTQMVTGCETWEAWAMAVGIDCAYISLKATLLTASDKVRKQVGTLAETAIVATLAGSAAMNIAAFTAAATNAWMTAGGILMGLAVPGLLFVLAQAGAVAWADAHARA